MKSENNGNYNILRDVENQKINAETSRRKKRSMPQEEDEDEEPLNLGVYQKSSILPILLSHAFVNQDKVEQDDNSAKSTFFRFTFFLIDGSKKKIDCLK